MDKEKLITKIREYHQVLIDLATGKKTDPFYERYEEVRKELLQLDQSIVTAIPSWIYDNRYGSNFWTFIKSVSPQYQPRRDFINKSFSDLYDFIEKGANQPVSLSINEINTAVKNEYVDLLWKKIYSRKSKAFTWRPPSCCVALTPVVGERQRPALSSAGRFAI